MPRDKGADHAYPVVKLTGQAVCLFVQLKGLGGEVRLIDRDNIGGRCQAKERLQFLRAVAALPCAREQAFVIPGGLFASKQA